MDNFLDWLFPSAPDVKDLKLDLTDQSYQRDNRTIIQNKRVGKLLNWLFPVAPDMKLNSTQSSNVAAPQDSKESEKVNFQEQEQASVLATRSVNSSNLETKSGLNAVSESSRIKEKSDLIPAEDTESPNILVLDNLYNSSLEKGMVFLTRVISWGNKDTFAFDLEDWIKAVNYQPIEAFAIILKNDGCYEEALAFYNQLYKLRPNFSLIHYNAMKVLAASGQFQKAYRAMQLWCLANIPEKAAIRALKVPIEAIPDLGPGVVEFVSLDPFNISMWSFAVSDAMYHLGTLHTIVSGNMPEADKQAYVASVSGNGGKPTHDIKAATELGESLVERLPWNVVYAEAKGEFWAWLKAYSMSLYSFAHHAAAQHANQ